MAISGIFASFSSILITYVTKLNYSRPVCFSLALLLSYTALVPMLIWKPNSSQAYVLYIFPCMLAISGAITDPFVTGLFLNAGLNKRTKILD